MFDISPHLANALLSLFNAVLILGSALVLIGTIGAIWTAGISARFADVRISANEAKTAKAHESASKAEQQTEELRKSNLTLQSDFERERTERLKLEAKVAPRRLSAVQSAALITILNPFAGQKVSITCLMGDTEGKQLAVDLTNVFRSAKWTGVEQIGFSQVVMDRDPIGIQIEISPAYKTKPLPQHFVAAINALHKIGIVPPQAPLIASIHVPEDTIAIMIGRKPD